MKAVVTFELDEMPKNCGDCLLVMDFKETNCLACMGINDTIPNNANDGIIGVYLDPEYQIELYERKPDWCPLKELPERDELPDWILKGTLDYTPDDTEHTEQQLAYSIGYNHGWNACLKAIENGEEG